MNIYGRMGLPVKSLAGKSLGYKGQTPTGTLRRKQRLNALQDEFKPKGRMGRI
ncbi:hypothetical protein [Pedobacter gandavensis]|uniref:Uncharacterized protein n=1 Tax=Pedobacter gandavensis TaxID=2679963 RepID=A0ABR6ETG6_9SPHI|nr:hypothetical protein [Pedobacter gandavensis]MBB2148553.1 hypothetical protein [Pedobacter gandavensis]